MLLTLLDCGLVHAQVIGATTIDEFRKYIEKDAALERRFQPVFVNEPTEGEAIQILQGLQDKYERYHKCVYTEEAVEAAVKLSSKYIADRFLPDKVCSDVAVWALYRCVGHTLWLCGLCAALVPFLLSIAKLPKLRVRSLACLPFAELPEGHSFTLPAHISPQAIDLLDEAGSRARILAYQARRQQREVENPKVREYLQVSGAEGWRGGPVLESMEI